MANAHSPSVQRCGSIRIQALSSTLVRLELEGPKGFEDRPTFHILERSWPGTPLRREETESAVILHSEHWSVWVPKDAQDLNLLRITDPQGLTLYGGGEAPTCAKPLPAPGEHPLAWAIGDRPRLVPPKWGATPSPSSSYAANSGWDLGNDAPDLYVFLPRGDYFHLRAELLQLTGRTELPPLYLFGAFHSRYFPYTDRGALAMIREYRERGFPLDVFMLDTHWRVNASYGYDINTRLFPDFLGFIEKAHQLGVRLGINDHPKAMTKNALDPREMEYRYANLARFLWMGVDFWWFDRNWDVCLTGPLPILCKEVWGMRVFHDMTRKAVPDRRPLILANVDGIDDGVYLWPPDIASHRFPFQWSGDTLLSWEELRRGVEHTLQAGVHSLIPYISEDLGCHEGMPSAEFFLRHWQYGVLSAVVRPHASNSIYFQREPWSFGPAVEAITRDYLNMRYRLLPYFYTAARGNFDTGTPLLRRLDLVFPDHPEAASNDQYLLGDSLLVAPILEGEGCNLTVPNAWLSTPEGAPGLLLELFANENLLGPPILRRIDAQIDVHWNRPSPPQALPPLPLSARWTGRLTASRPVQIGMFMEEGGRLFMDGQPIFDHWIQDQWLHSTCNHGLNTLILEPGQSYSLRVEARHSAGGLAKCQLFYRPMDLPAQPMNRSVWIPEGEWIDAWTGTRHQGPRFLQARAPVWVIPMYVRAGSLFPLAPAMQHSDERPWDPITLDLYPHAERVARAELYEDDHWSNAYLEGDCRRTAFTAKLDKQKAQILIQIDPSSGPYLGAPAERSWLLRLHGCPEIGSITQVSIDGQPCPKWSVQPKGHPATPFQLQGPASDGEVLEVALPSRPITLPRTITIGYRA